MSVKNRAKANRRAALVAHLFHGGLAPAPVAKQKKTPPGTRPRIAAPLVRQLRGTRAEQKAARLERAEQRRAERAARAWGR